MANDLNQPVHFEDEIDLKKIFKILIEFKKLIISTIFIFTIVSILYSLSLKPSFISSSKFEIGYFERLNGDETQKLIEKPLKLISDLNVLIRKNPDNKFNQALSMDELEGKVLTFKTSSNSIEQNENFLTEIHNYIYERHSKLVARHFDSEKLITEREKNLSATIENVKEEITYLESKLSDQYQSQYLNIISKLDKEIQGKEYLQLLYRNSSSRDQVFHLNQSLVNLTNELDSHKYSILQSKYSILKSKSQILGNIETITTKPKTQLIILLGIILGFFTSTLLVFIKYFVKSYKESQA